MSFTLNQYGMQRHDLEVSNGNVSSVIIDINTNNDPYPGDYGFIVVMGSFHTTYNSTANPADIYGFLQTSFLKGDGTTIVQSVGNIRTPYTTSDWGGSGTYSDHIRWNYYSQHGGANYNSQNGERHSFMFHIANNPQTKPENIYPQDAPPGILGHLHMSGSYFYIQHNGTVISTTGDQHAKQDGGPTFADNMVGKGTDRIQKLKIFMSSGYITKYRIKSYGIGVRDINHPFPSSWSPP